MGSAALEKNVQGIWRVGLNWSAARSLAIADVNWSAARSLAIADLTGRQPVVWPSLMRSGDSTHPCRSPIPTANGGDLFIFSRHGHKRLSRNTVTWQSVTGGRQRRDLLKQLPESFSRGTRSCGFSWSTKHL